MNKEKNFLENFSVDSDWILIWIQSFTNAFKLISNKERT